MLHNVACVSQMSCFSYVLSFCLFIMFVCGVLWAIFLLFPFAFSTIFLEDIICLLD